MDESDYRVRGILSAVAAAAVVAMLAVTAPSWRGEHEGDDEEQRELTRTVRRQGELLSLDQVLALARRQVDGKVLEAKLEREDGVMQYEIEVLGPGGRLHELRYDARSGSLLKAEED